MRWMRRNLVMTAKNIFSCSFEIHGRVQGVYFRKYTQRESQKLQLRGWVMNTDAGTVKGELEGKRENLRQMQKWLETKGSPESRIEKAVFGDIKQISKHRFDNFTIRE